MTEWALPVLLFVGTAGFINHQLLKGRAHMKDTSIGPVHETFEEWMAKHAQPLVIQRHVRIEDAAPDRKVLRWHNGSILGEAILDVSGDWLFFPHPQGGWSSFTLQKVAETLHVLNRG